MDIASEIKKKVHADNICNVIIAGGTCSGKTTLATNLHKQLAKEFSVSVIKQDDYFKDIQDVPRIRKGYLMDSPNAFHTNEFQKDVRQLLNEGSTVIPRYDVAVNKRISKDVTITHAQINIFEGLHTISLLGELPNALTVFMITPLEICLERRVNRDKKLFGVAEERIRENFEDCITPMYHSYIAPQIECAEIKLEGVDLDGTA
jgi:uridine kinase